MTSTTRIGGGGRATARKKVPLTVKRLTASFHYLDVLRETGVTNMYGAAPYLMRDLGRSRDQAVAELSLWMKTFAKNEPVIRAQAALVLQATGRSPS